MKLRAAIFIGLNAGLTATALLNPAPAFATSGSLVHTVTILSRPLEGLKFPVVGTLGEVSLSTLPVLDKLKKGIPVVGTITVHDALNIFQSISALQRPLPGLGNLNTALAKATAKLP